MIECEGGIGWAMTYQCILQSVTKENDKWQWFAQLMWTGWWTWCKYTTQFVQHPCFWSIQTFQMFLWTASLQEKTRKNSIKTNIQWHIYNEFTRIKLLGVMFSPFKIIAVCVAHIFMHGFGLFADFLLCAVYFLKWAFECCIFFILWYIHLKLQSFYLSMVSVKQTPVDTMRLYVNRELSKKIHKFHWDISKIP